MSDLPNRNCHKKYCVIGKSLPHTLSPQIHKEFGLDYGVVELKDEDAVAEWVKNNDFDGYNVTVPYKRVVMPLLDWASERAQDIGAVNTVVVRDKRTFGYNTDVHGIEYALQRSGIAVKDKICAILGSGGTSHTMKYVLNKMGAKEIVVVSRSGEINYENVYDRKDLQLVFNTTPVGMYPHVDESPLDLKPFAALEGVFDAVYNPLKTTLILQAESLGLKTTNGLNMLVEQGRVARDIFVGEESDETLTQRVVAKLQREAENIVLVGMPGSGKSTIGKAVAEQLGKKFVDTDDEIVRLVGKSIPDIFAEDGEEKFRQYESQVIENCAKELNQVIATGGGAVMKKTNRIALKRNGFTILVKRDINQLARDGRPLSMSTDLSKMQAERMPVYEEMANAEIVCNGILNDAIEEIKRVL